ncbi:MAG: hypothetical protein UX91_C0003G0030 [Candidatus Amesbacteria bacterium GW2011_GWB1_47_19]|nr:MAG: hypothetical protein UW51_C0003G0036 [Candidatus Amesbacteria bacterium GW2011_GWA1_44_24]KKU31461.1 MAG: hypothetical protein UX46_C0005G0030 [Candidatus Amesbacteria bacterium GW2011_GWC1_46_24]KKU67469.1 MAG: hypothetical protein UX91_C0003G0030 [Candidatus Amesbacteria bacterium GW2011_GWB1_47_19]OGD05119.1 MAG: hypothetical protein A2379_05060 [Candidatus Amesbacteria bacterium RIFOXYB1_FULL_47_13]HBC72477.1 hypothetical protein [Candidatus Amesbacteria bacterium]
MVTREYDLLSFSGSIKALLENGGIHLVCWEFAQRSDKGGHRGVEGAEVVPRRKLRRDGNARKAAVKKGEWD